MDGSIRRIQDQVAIQPATSRRRSDSSSRRFTIDGEAPEDESPESQEPEVDEHSVSADTGEDLPVGKASHDEAGVRIDLTA